jgi:NTP pyrophosphatase (non-canonical NTP hydrolase)
MEPLLRRLRQFRDERDWSKFHTPKDLAVSVSIEAGELLELFQWRAEAAPVEDEVKAAVADEAADVLLYLLMLCDRLDIDLEAAAHLKISRNESRYPIESSFGLARSRRKV